MEQKFNPKQMEKHNNKQRSIVVTSVLATNIDIVQHIGRCAGSVWRPTNSK